MHTTPILELLSVEKRFAARRGGAPVRAVDGVSVAVARGETLGLVGESGCGKSTLARLALRLLPVTRGKVLFDGEDVTHLPEHAMRRHRKRLQVIFQDPYATLNPRMTLRQLFDEVYATHGLVLPEGRDARTRALLGDVGMGDADLAKYPRGFSGGQLQRIGIARALALDPDIIIADEPTSALDPSIQAQIVNLMLGIRQRRGVAFLLISHDLEVVGHLADRIAVMYLGRIIEQGQARQIIEQPAHPYTQALLSAAPSLAQARPRLRIRLAGDPPNPAHLPTGCRFHPRCRLAHEACQHTEPALTRQADGRLLACHLGLRTLESMHEDHRVRSARP